MAYIQESVTFKGGPRNSFIQEFLLFLFAVLIILPLAIVLLVFILLSEILKKCFASCSTKATYDATAISDSDGEEMPPCSSRKYDLIVVGVTGFTGGLAADYMASAYGKDDSLSWAIAGRSPKKVQAVLSRMKENNPGMKEIDVIIADNMKIDDMMRLAMQTRAVASFAGPFLKYGSNLVRACAMCGTHYSDSTGEFDWIKQMIAYYHDTAVNHKCRIVPACGWDCVPSDLSLYLCYKALQEENEDLKSVKFGAVMKGAVSGGTLETVRTMLSRPNIPMPPLGFNPLYYYNRQKNKCTFNSRVSPLADRHPTGDYGGFSFFGDNNCNSLKRMGAFYGWKKIEYYETMITGKSWFQAMGVSIITIFGLLLMVFPPTCYLLSFVLPKPGEGLSTEGGKFHVNITGKGTKGTEVYAMIAADEDPGYVSCARMVIEAALAQLDLDNDPSAPFGILVPGCIGDVYVDRLQKTGTRIAVGKSWKLKTKTKGSV